MVVSIDSMGTFSENQRSPKSNLLLCCRTVLFWLVFCRLASNLHSEEIQIDRYRGRVTASNDRTHPTNFEHLPNSRPNWWQKKANRTLFVNDEPIGTGVPTWKEIDIYGQESRKGRSFAYRAENGSVGNQLRSSLVVIGGLTLALFASDWR